MTKETIKKQAGPAPMSRAQSASHLISRTNSNATSYIVKKWYAAIGFDRKYDDSFYSSLETIEIDGDASVDSYNLECDDGKKNFLYFLYFCEETLRKYNERGIGEDILLHSLQEIPRWLETWSQIKGELYLGELPWLAQILNAKIFRLGRLEYCFAKNYKQHDDESKNNVIAIHIPSGSALTPDECKKSLDMARDFYARFYPEYHWEKFTCRSWLLGEELGEILGENSNIVSFQKLFTIEAQEANDSILTYVFNKKATRENIEDFEVKSGFAKKVKELVKTDGIFHVGTGYIDR